jgi:hypothetical protein
MDAIEDGGLGVPFIADARCRFVRIVDLEEKRCMTLSG